MTAQPAGHTTHYDDCGCLSARYDTEIESLQGEAGAWKVAANETARADELQALAVIGELTVADRPYDWRIDEIKRVLGTVASLGAGLTQGATRG